MTATVSAGSLIGGRYRVDKILGRGGMGVVWAALDTLLQRQVALKEIHLPPAVDDLERERLQARVLREARAAARLSHPSVVAVYDVVDEADRPFIVMELVRAPSLSELVARRGPLPRRQVAEIGAAIAGALAAAHAAGIVHRDVKPANVLVPDHGPPRLTDFGIASVADDTGGATTQRLVGSPSYMSPEQANNVPLNAATDRWSLGATLYYAVEGVPPFDRGEALPTLTSILSDPPRPTQRAGALTPILMSLLAKEPGARPTDDETVAALAAAVGPAATSPSRVISTTPTLRLDEDQPTHLAPAPVLASEPHTTSLPARRVDPPAGPAPPPARHRRSWPWVAAAVAVVLVAALAVTAGLLRQGSTGRTTGAAAPTTTAARPVATAAPAPAPAVPADWVPYRDPSTGFSISHPPGWTVATNGTLTDFRDPTTGAYLRVDHRSPPDPSPVEDWRAFEPSFAAANAGYQRIQITPTTYDGFRAATWEYTYGPGGSLHAVDLGFVVGTRYGFALNFQAPSADWQRLQPVFMAFQQAFRAPQG